MSSAPLRLFLAQYNLCVGDIDGNAARVFEAAERGATSGADLVLLPELALSGYPPEDLLFHSGFRRQVQAAEARVEQQVLRASAARCRLRCGACAIASSRST